MNLIRPKQMENLISSYTDLKAVLKSVQVEIGALSGQYLESDNDYISHYLGNRRNDGSQPSVGNESDFTGDIAVTYKKNECIENKKLAAELSNEILQLKTVIEKIDIGLNSLKERNRAIVKGLYIDKMTWKEIASKNSISERTAQIEKSRAIYKMIKVSRITITMYEKVIKNV